MDSVPTARGRPLPPPPLVSLVLLAALAALAACGKAPSEPREVKYTWAPPKAAAVAGVPAAAITASLAQQVAGAPPAGVSPDTWEHVQRLYREYQGAPLWMDSSGPIRARTDALLGALADAPDDALDLSQYPLEPLADAVRQVRDATPATAEALARADVLLSTAYLGLSEDLLSGQLDPKETTKDWHIARGHEQLDSAVVQSLRADDLAAGIARMRPEDPEYLQLRDALKQLRAVVDSGGWPEVPEGPALTRGATAPAARLALLRRRLRMEGIEVGDPAEDSVALSDTTAGAGAAKARADYDRALAGAVSTWQERHGIPADGVLGAETVKALNVPAERRLGQVAASLERHRWMPRSLGQRYIYVNVPAFRLRAVDSAGTGLEMKVIVGQEYEGKTTPVFADSMETVVFRPYWNVTPDIQAKEIGPKVAADPGYLAANDMEYYKDGGETRVRQRPGPKNSLGLVKFLFPNSFNIYLHDTPSRLLFLKDMRAFSHGCIRLEQPAELAQWVLGWDPDRVETAMEEGPNDRAVRLPKKIPVYITYFTAYMRDGQLYFGNDLYSRDEGIITAMASAARGTPETARGVADIRKLVTE